MTSPLLRMDEHIMSILESGIAAPSADNHHRYSVRLATSEGRTAIRCYTHSRELNYPWRRRYVDWISYGAAVENMMLRSYDLRMQPTLRLELEDSENLAAPKLFAQLELQLSPNSDALVAAGSASLLAQAIPTRISNRSPYLKKPIDNQTRSTLLDAVVECPDIHCTWISAPDELNQLSAIASLAETERLQSDTLHQEVFKSIYLSDEDRQYGISTKGFGMPTALQHLLMLLKKDGVIVMARRLGLTRLLGQMVGGLPIRSSSAVLMFSGQNDDISNFFNAGRAMERVWLAATLNGLSVQPLIGSCLLSLPKTEGVSAATQLQLQRYWTSRLPPGEVPLILLRIGYATKSAWKSPRPPVESLFIR